MNSSTTCIECSDQPLDVAFHPNIPTFLAAALVDGTVEIHDFQEIIQNCLENRNIDLDDDDEPDTIISSTHVHTQLLPSKITECGSKLASCRTILFSQSELARMDDVSGHGSSGKTILYTGGTAGDLVALDAERLCTFSKESTLKKCQLWRVSDASRSPINVLYELLPTTASGAIPLLASGDDKGCVRVWDTRICGNRTTSSSSTSSVATGKNNPAGCVMSWQKHDDYISGFDQSPLDPNVLLASSADCRISVYDLRMAANGANYQQIDGSVRLSDDIEDELLSIKVIKNGKKVVCGSANGVLNVWSYGTWGDISDRFPGHPKSVDALLKFDENTLLTGSSDGLIRVVSIHPDQMLGVLGDHEGYPIEHLQFNSDRSFVGSVTHDNVIRLWDTKILSDDDSDNEENGNVLKTKSKLRALPSNTLMLERESDDEWDDMDDDTNMKDADNDDDSNSNGTESDDSDDDHGRKKRFDRLKTDNEKFFEDL
jgi:WD repeat-containing protein 55